MKIDVAIFGGGVSGLWLLDDLTRHGYQAVLLEAGALGFGQTVGAQGIIHGGMKYALSGWMTKSARNIREMPGIWRDCLAGKRSPDLSGVRMRTRSCYLWRTRSLWSKLGFLGARFGLRVTPQSLPKADRPEPLKRCPGLVARLDEPVLCPDSMLRELAEPHRDRLLKIDPVNGLRFDQDSSGDVQRIGLYCPELERSLVLTPGSVVLTAGGGNQELCDQLGLAAPKMQRRPLHMVMLRGPLPELNGHCVDGAKTRATITSDVDSRGRTVWQVGGQVAELGVAMDDEDVIDFAIRELSAVLPGVDFTGVEAATYRVDRAEAQMPTGLRPDDVQVTQRGNVIVGWPTKLAFAPRLADDVRERLPVPSGVETPLPNWTAPKVAEAPWETRSVWRAVSPAEGSANSSAVRAA